MKATEKIYCSLLALLLFCTSCAQNNDKQPVLELLNEEVFYYEVKEDQLYYEDDDQRAKSLNLITFKLSNPTDRKILFCIDRDRFWYPILGKIEKSKEPDMFFSIQDSVSIAGISRPFINYPDSEEMNTVAFDIQDYNDRNVEKKYDIKGVSAIQLRIVDHYVRNSIVLHPNETKTFKVLLHLPIVQEINPKIGQYDLLLLHDLHKFNKFQLYYSADAEYLKSVLPEFLLKELEENNIEIFDGILYSNEVPLKKR